MENLASLALGGAALVAGLTAGVFLSFSDFIMRGLGQSDPKSGMDAMVQINRTVLRSFFLTSFFGLVPVSLGLAFWGMSSFQGLAATLTVAGAIAYIAFVFLVTIFGNVPMNQRLDRLETGSDEGLEYWSTYLRDWTRLNTVRTVGNTIAAACFLAAAVLIGTPISV